jgi:hypothetical protein
MLTEEVWGVWFLCYLLGFYVLRFWVLCSNKPFICPTKIIPRISNTTEKLQTLVNTTRIYSLRFYHVWGIIQLVPEP